MVVLILIAVPILEIVAAALVAHLIGWWPTIGLLVLASLLGIWQLKIQGLGAMAPRTRRAPRRSVARSIACLDGGLRLFGALLLALPGFLTALASLPFLLAPTRRVVAGHAEAWSIGRLRVPFMVVTTVSDAGGTVIRRRRNNGAVDVEGWEVPVHDPSDGPPPALPRSDPHRY